MPLSDTSLRKLKPREKPFKIMDVLGLYVLVPPNGSRLFRFDYQFQGKRKTLALGSYPAVSLAEARGKRDEAKIQISRGVDPALQRKLSKLAEKTKAGNTFGVVAAEYLERLEHDGSAATTLRKNRWMLDELAKDLARRPIADITAAEILKVLQHVERSGRHESARRLRSTISAVFRLGVATLRAPMDPTYALKGATRAPKVVNRAAIVDEKQFGALMNSIDEYDGWPTLRCALQFIALTVARPGEVRCAEWSEIDMAQRIWVIPAQRTKTRRKHEVPLSRQALAVLADIERFSARCKLVFPSIRSETRPLSDAAMNSALRRMGYKQEEHSSHGFRSSFSTIMNDRKFDPEAIERALAHVDGSVRAIYNRGRGWDDRVALMQSWADLLDEFRGGTGQPPALTTKMRTTLPPLAATVRHV